MTDRDNYNKIFDNGVSHLNSAKLLADNNEFGHAISHLVLGIEELIKYQVTATHSADNTLFTDKEINPQKRESIFRLHQTKHDLLAEFIEAGSNQFTEIFREYVFYLATGQNLKPEHQKIKENRFKEIGNLINGAFTETNFTEEERTAFFDWLKEANNNKNDGFYVDVKNNVWKTPKDFSKMNYDVALKYATVILSQTKIIKDLDITDDEFIDLLNSDGISKSNENL